MFARTSARPAAARLTCSQLESRDVPSVLSPAEVRRAYGFDQLTFPTPSGRSAIADGAGQTIALVTAYGNPHVRDDLAAFAQRFGLPGPPRLGIIDQFGDPMATVPPPPPELAAWATEASIDLQWAHAIAPGANLLLVEAYSPSDADLLQAVDTAKKFPGVTVVSMSFGRPEFPGQSLYDPVFTSPPDRGVTFVAAAGDVFERGQFAAFSPNVLGVGGTTLTVAPDGSYLGEVPWHDGTPAAGGSTGSAGGFSRTVSAPSWQRDVIQYPAGQAPMRGAPDVAFVADSVWIVDSTSPPTPGVSGSARAVSGTSVAAPIWAGLIALVDQARAANGKRSLDGPAETLPALYALPASAWRDIADPSYPGGGRWDWSTGLGTPRVDAVLAGLLQVGSSASPPPPVAPPPPPVQEPPQTPSNTPTDPPADNGGEHSGGDFGETFGQGGTVAAGSGEGVVAAVTAYNADGSPRFQVTPFGPGFRGGVRVATGDFNGDGVAEVVAGPGRGRTGTVALLDGVTGVARQWYQTFEDSFTGGVFVATGDFSGDGVPDVVVTPDVGGGPRVLVLDGVTGKVLADFLGIEDANFRGGVRPAVGDLNGDGIPDLIIAAGAGGGPRVAVFDGRSLGSPDGPRKLIADFFAMDPNLRDGLYVAAGDLSGLGRADLVVGAGPGGAPRVLVLSGADLIQTGGQAQPRVDFFAGSLTARGGAPVGVTKLLNGKEGVAVAPGQGTTGPVRVFSDTALQTAAIMSAPPVPTFDLDPFPGSRGGVFVG